MVPRRLVEWHLLCLSGFITSRQTLCLRFQTHGLSRTLGKCTGRTTQPLLSLQFLLALHPTVLPSTRQRTFHVVFFPRLQVVSRHSWLRLNSCFSKRHDRSSWSTATVTERPSLGRFGASSIKHITQRCCNKKGALRK